MPVGETGIIYISHLFVTNSGDMWGQNEWDVRMFDKKPIPLLSKFDESKQQFEFALNVLDVLPQMQHDSPIWPVVVLDDEDVFWIFDTSGDIYSYDTNNKKTKKHNVSIPDSFATQVALSTDGNIYIQTHKLNNLNYLSQGDLFMFDPMKNKIFPVDVPKDPWPIFLKFSMFLDQTGNLWIDSLGYRDSKGDWYLTFPDEKQYYSHLGEPEWFMPILQLESSDGRLWFYKATDILSVDGTAWYNPKSGEGCVFTNLPAKVFEDDEEQLWLTVDGKLYKHP